MLSFGLGSCELTNYPRFLFCITLINEIWSVKDRLSGGSRGQVVADTAEPPKQETTVESREPDNQAAATKAEDEVA
jgi:hypothetical protein